MHLRTTAICGGTNSYDWCADVTKHTKPDVEAKPRKIKGVIHYIGKGSFAGKLYVKEVFDRIWNVAKGKVMQGKPKIDRVEALISELSR